MRRLLRLINGIDEKINTQVNDMLHQPEFQQLESAWRGLAYLVAQSPQTRTVKIKLLTLSYHQAESTRLFELIHTQEFDQSGGEPFGILIIDYVNTDQGSFLQDMTKIAEKSFCLVIASTHSNPLQRKQSQFIALVTPDCLARPPWQPPYSSAKNRWFTEQLQQNNHYCWSRANYVLAATVINSFKQSGWFNHLHTYQAMTKTNHHPPINVQFTQKQVQHLNQFGIVCITQQKTTGECYFQYPANYSIESILTASRFAHYIKVIARDKIGCFAQTQACEDFLQTWLLQFCALDHYPLKYAKVQLAQDTQQPEKLNCTITLQPRLTIPSQEARLRLTSQLQY